MNTRDRAGARARLDLDLSQPRVCGSRLVGCGGGVVGRTGDTLDGKEGGKRNSVPGWKEGKGVTSHSRPCQPVYKQVMLTSWSRFVWLLLQPAHTRFQASTQLSAGLLGLTSDCLINKPGTTSAVPCWALSPISQFWGALLGRVLQFSRDTPAVSPVSLPYGDFSETTFWSFFVAHFSIGSRQESHGVWAETSSRNSSSL